MSEAVMKGRKIDELNFCCWLLSIWPWYRKSDVIDAMSHKKRYRLEGCLESAQTIEVFAKNQRSVACLFLVCVGLHQGLRRSWKGAWCLRKP